MGRFRASYTGIGAMLCSPGMQREMGRRAKKVRDQAKRTAPVGDENDPHRGAYRDSITSTAIVQRRKTRRAAGVVTADVPYAFQLEFGHVAHLNAQGRYAPRGQGVRTVVITRHRTLGKALDAARD